MPLSPYSGTAIRAGHFSVRPSAPGVNADHTTPSPEPDPFNPVPDTPAQQAGTVWNGEPEHLGQSNAGNLAQVPVSHWFDGQPSVPSGETYPRAQLAMQERMLWDHEQANYIPDSIRLHRHWSEGQVNDFVPGRPPVAAGASIPDGPLAGLGNGRNSYDQTNGPTVVYSAGESNVGRYRLGVKTNLWGLYQNPLGKFGQDANLRAYTGLVPQFPFDKPVMVGTAPYTPNSTGTAAAPPAAPYQVPSMFTAPSETAITDYALTGQAGSASPFRDGGRL